MVQVAEYLQEMVKKVNMACNRGIKKNKQSFNWTAMATILTFWTTSCSHLCKVMQIKKGSAMKLTSNIHFLLCHFFSPLGVNPYPGMQVNEKFYKLIQNGFKMDRPFYATEEMYVLGRKVRVGLARV